MEAARVTGDDQRPFAMHAKARQHNFDADQLQRDVRHGRDDAGGCNGERQGAAVKTAAYKIGCSDIAMFARHRPQPRKRDKHQRIGDGCVGHGEKADRARTEHQRGNCDERVSGIKIAAQQKPGDDGAKAATAKAPFIQKAQITFAPARGDKAQPGDQDEQGGKDNQRNPIERGSHRCYSRPLSRGSVR